MPPGMPPMPPIPPMPPGMPPMLPMPPGTLPPPGASRFIFCISGSYTSSSSSAAFSRSATRRSASSAFSKSALVSTFRLTATQQTGVSRDAVRGT
eukprot:6734819-Prymnesium_polylepis.1